MVKKVTPAQLRSMMRQQEQQMRRDISRYNREVDKVNKANKKAIDDYNRQVNTYNRDVRAHNAAVRQNRQRLKTELSRLSKQKTVTTTTYVVDYRQSFDVLRRASTRVEELGGNEQLLDLVEGEAANSAEVLNSLLEEAPDTAARDAGDDELADLQATSLGEELDALPVDLQHRWEGALYALNPRNPEAARHFCTSAREILVRLVDDAVPDADVMAADPHCEMKNGQVARRAKITYCLSRKNYPAGALPEMIEADVDNVLNLFGVVNGGTHGSAGRYDIDRLVVIKRRVEDALRFLHVLLN